VAVLVVLGRRVVHLLGGDGEPKDVAVERGAGERGEPQMRELAAGRDEHPCWSVPTRSPAGSVTSRPFSSWSRSRGRPVSLGPASAAAPPASAAVAPAAAAADPVASASAGSERSAVPAAPAGRELVTTSPAPAAGSPVAVVPVVENVCALDHGS
jgi:hypothetical protein